LAAFLKVERLGRVQADYITKILAAFPESLAPLSIHDRQVVQIEPLTNRELEVLHLMAEGPKYGEIAEGLYISLNTVRSHVKAIYGKLNVNNRTKAVEKAHQLGIL
jgi:LuxR family maltose regulon positive regulatory protein